MRSANVVCCQTQQLEEQQRVEAEAAAAEAAAAAARAVEEEYEASLPEVVKAKVAASLKREVVSKPAEAACHAASVA